MSEELQSIEEEKENKPKKFKKKGFHSIDSLC